MRLDIYVGGLGMEERNFESEMVDIGGQKLDPDLATLFGRDPRVATHH